MQAIDAVETSAGSVKGLKPVRPLGRYVERHLQAEGVQDGLLAGGSGKALSDPAVGGEGDQAVEFVARLRQASLAAFSATRPDKATFSTVNIT